MKKLSIILLAAVVLPFAGCKKWLDVQPIDRSQEDKLFKTEEGINGVLNGFYRELTGENLYGGRLTMFHIEAMARYYDFPSSLTGLGGTQSEIQTLASTHSYNTDQMKTQLGAIWTSAYKMFLGLNTYIKNVKNSDVMNDERRHIYLGEVFGIRAMLHLDIYRLYGPITPDEVDITGETPKILPYSNIYGINILSYETPRDYLNLVLDDIEIALAYLADDPIYKDGKVYDMSEDQTNLSPIEKFPKIFRNKRMNYYAVQTLKLRTLMLLERFEEADDLSKLLIEQAVAGANTEDDKPFNPTNTGPNGIDYVYYNEVIFGPNNLDQSTRWSRRFNKGEANNDWVLNNTNVYGNMMFAGADYRNLQWLDSQLLGGAKGGLGDKYFISRKYSNVISYESSSNADYIGRRLRYMQVLMRISEWYYTRAEAHLRMNGGNVNTAISCINAVLARRGFQENTGIFDYQAQLPANATSDQVWQMLDVEYYREFFMEGQTFFYLKRNNKTEMMGGNVAGKVIVDESAYLPVLPNSETDFL